MTTSPAEAVEQLQSLFRSIEIEIEGTRRTWLQHISLNNGRGYSDEETLVQPRIFPAFAEGLLGFEVGVNLAPEQPGPGGTPDFTPADRVTHQFVFETKGSKEGVHLTGFDSQIEKYLRHTPNRQVVLTNMVGIRVFETDAIGRVVQVGETIDLRFLAQTPAETAARLPLAKAFADFIDRYSRKDLSTADKIHLVRRHPAWDPAFEFSDPEWLRARIQGVVDILQRDVVQQVEAGRFRREAVDEAEETAALDELRGLATRFQMESKAAATAKLQTFVAAAPASPAGKAMRQYMAHVAYFHAAKLVLVRVWEDTGLLQPATLYDGGFDDRMSALSDDVDAVISFAFSKAQQNYRTLFRERPAFSWYRPTREAAVDAIYELATTFLGGVGSDVLGEVYEGTLQRIDRKLLGQYYTPRDIIALIWDLIEQNPTNTQSNPSMPRVLDIAAGSGGFLVEGLRRRKSAYLEQKQRGSVASDQEWVNGVADAFNGVEIQRFSALLAEMNMIIQLSSLLGGMHRVTLPELGIIPADTLSLCDRATLQDIDPDLIDSEYLDVTERKRRALAVKYAEEHQLLFDVVVGNPPYIGEKLAAPLIRDLRSKHPYWMRFVSAHPDYLYYFLILGISKLRQGGLFGFITTEYWLRASGAEPLRRFIAEHAQIDNIVLFRDMRLFPDATGQHSMIVIGHAQKANASEDSGSKPQVSIYSGPNLSVRDRRGVLDLIRAGRSSGHVKTFRATTSPNQLGGASWAELILTRNELLARRRVKALPQVGELEVTKGVETTIHRLPADAAEYLPAPVLASLGFPDRRAGVQLLTSDEVTKLGPLTDTELDTLRPHLNTADILPYACVLPDNPDWIVYLPKPDGNDWRFPPDMPQLETYLARFRPILEEKVRSRGENRPWWTLHRPRAHIVRNQSPESARWANYCVTTRWGAGNRLIVGLAPIGSVPASGLHMLSLSGSNEGAAYVCGLMNSSMFQDQVSGFAPGQIRQAELRELGVPDLGEAKRKLVVDLTLKLAELVAESVIGLTGRFPGFRAALLNDLDLGSLPEGWKWSPQSKLTTGTIQSVAWIEVASRTGSQATRVVSVEERVSLFGREVVLIGDRPGAGLVLAVKTDSDSNHSVVSAWARGLASQGAKLNSISEIEVPLTLSELVERYESDRSDLEQFSSDYRSMRAAIDDCLT